VDPDRAGRPPDRDGPVPGTSASTWWTTAAVVAFTAVAGLYAFEAVTGNGRYAPGILVVPLLGVAFFPLVHRIGDRWAPGFDFAGMALVGLAARCAAAVYRLEHGVDGIVYHKVGLTLADSFRRLDFTVDTGRQVPGTGAVRYVAGLVSVVANGSVVVEYLVFTAVAFGGLLCAYVAFATAVPDGDRRRYALLVLLWPSLVLWPSSIGKEALITGAFGVAALGAARLYTHRPGGFTLLGAGILGVTMVRPHVALLAALATFLGYLFVRSTGGSTALSATKAVTIIVLGVGGALVVGQTAQFLRLEKLGTEDVEEVRTQTQARTEQGGGSFTPIRADNPARYPGALVTVLFRPFPTEARSAEALLTGVEGVVLLGLVVTSWRRWLALPQQLVRAPYVAFALSTVLLFAYAFSVIANFGILARQRTQILPYLFVLLAVPALSRRSPAAPRAVRPTPGPVAPADPGASAAPR
jgi:hypothetical protein